MIKGNRSGAGAWWSAWGISEKHIQQNENYKKNQLYRSHHHCVSNHFLFILFSDYSAQGIVDDDLSYDVELYYDGGKLFGSKIKSKIMEVFYGFR